MLIATSVNLMTNLDIGCGSTTLSREDILAAAENESILGMPKLRVMHRYLEIAQSIPGSAAELGVYRGGAAHMIARMLPEKTVYLFDSFAGMQHASEIDHHKEGEFADCSEQGVRLLLSDCPNAQFRVGWFPETAIGLDGETFALVHIDADQYQSTLDALTFFLPRLHPDGILIMDDYQWPHCPGVERALHECLPDGWVVTVEEQFQAIVRKKVEAMK